LKEWEKQSLMAPISVIHKATQGTRTPSLSLCEPKREAVIRLTDEGDTELQKS
jgi:hypothetical protein